MHLDALHAASSAGGRRRARRPSASCTASSRRTSSPDQVTSVLREASGQLVLEVRKTIDFYRATAPVERLSRIVLSGGAWQAVGLVDMLASEFGAPVDVFDPFRRITRPSRGIGIDAVGPGLCGRGRPRDAAGRRPMIRVNLLANAPGAAPKQIGCRANSAPRRSGLVAARRHGHRRRVGWWWYLHRERGAPRRRRSPPRRASSRGSRTSPTLVDQRVGAQGRAHRAARRSSIGCAP